MRARVMACALYDLRGRLNMVADYLPLLLRGAALSLCVMLSSLLVALLLGLINSLIKLFGPPWLRLFSTAYTTLVRGIPELVIMLLLFSAARCW